MAPSGAAESGPSDHDRSQVREGLPLWAMAVWAIGGGGGIDGANEVGGGAIGAMEA